MIASRFLARRRLLQTKVPNIGAQLLQQLTSLYPVDLIPRDTDNFADRACMSGVRVRDDATGVLYSTMIWNMDMKLKERQLRLYIRLPTGEMFLASRSMNDASALLAADPPLPRAIREEIEFRTGRHLREVA
jgi:hypothetical protein